MLKPNSAFAKQYILTRPIDTNGLAEVWEAVSTKKNFKNTVALKIFPELGQKEINNLKNKVPKSLKYSYGNLLPANHLDIYKNRPFLEMHFCNEGHIGKKLKGLNENEIRKCLIQIASALNTLHNNSITHKYIKPSNILMGKGNFYCYLPDLGLGKNLRLEIEKSFKTNNGNHSNDEVYLPRSFARVILNCYSAPELFKDNLNASAASDIWALGASLYEIAVGKAPFGYLGGEKQLKSDVLQDLPEKFSIGLNGLIKRCLSKNKEDRPSASEIVKWIEETEEKNAIISPKVVIDEKYVNNDGTKSIVEIVEKKWETEQNENRSTNDINGQDLKCEDAGILQLRELAGQKTTLFENVIEPVDNNGEAVNKFEDAESLQLQKIIEQEATQVENSIDPINIDNEPINKFEDAKSLQLQEIVEQETTHIEHSTESITANDEAVNKLEVAESLQLQEIVEQETTHIEHSTESITNNDEAVNKLEDAESLQLQEIVEQEIIHIEHSNELITNNDKAVDKLEEAERLQLQEIVEQETTYNEHSTEPITNNDEAVEKLEEAESLQFQEIVEQETTQVEHSTELINNNDEPVNKFEFAQVNHSSEPIVNNGETVNKLGNTEILQLQDIVGQGTMIEETGPKIDGIEQVEKDKLSKADNIVDPEPIVNEIMPEFSTVQHLKKYDNVQILELQNLAEQETTTDTVHDPLVNNAFEPSTDNYPLNKQSAEKETNQIETDDLKMDDVVDLILNNPPIDKDLEERQSMENENENVHVNHTIYVTPPNNVIHPLLIKLITNETLTSESETFPPTTIIDKALDENVANLQFAESQKVLNGKKTFPFNTTIDLSLYSDTIKRSIREQEMPGNTKKKLLILFSILVAAGIFFVFLKWRTNEPEYTIQPVRGWPINKIDSNRAIIAQPQFPVNKSTKKPNNVTITGNDH